MFHGHAHFNTGAPSHPSAPFREPVFFAPPTAGEIQRDTHHKSQLARLLYINEVGGQAPVDDEGTVPTSLARQYDLVFQNVEGVLHWAGAKGWGTVFLIKAYCVIIEGELGMEDHEREMGKCISRYMETVEEGVPQLSFRMYTGVLRPHERPVVKMVGVERLEGEGWRVVLEVVTYG